jgi:hypothetical protein
MISTRLTAQSRPRCKFTADFKTTPGFPERQFACNTAAWPAPGFPERQVCKPDPKVAVSWTVYALFVNFCDTDTKHLPEMQQKV